MSLIWTRHLSVHIEEFDEDHRQLLKILNELEFAVKSAVSGKVESIEIEIAMHRLENYSKSHCADEEKLLEETGYPDLDLHKLEHAGLIKMLGNLKLRLHDSSDPKHALELIGFVYGWVTNHVNVTDKQYAQFLHDHAKQCAVYFAAKKHAPKSGRRREPPIQVCLASNSQKHPYHP
ncbi:MAG: bacteriohemerythrin [Terracidiphilus sp.]|jgi:hemerythrin